MRSFGGYCRIATALGDISLRYAHNVRETFRSARFGRFYETRGGGRQRAPRARRASWASNAPHCLSIRNCADAGTLSMHAMLRLTFSETVTSGSLGPCDVHIGSSRNSYDVRNLERFIAGFFGKRPRSFVLCFRYSTMAITAIFERGTHARRSYQARRGI